MTTPSHTSIGIVIYNLPLPLPIKIILMTVSHFILDIFNEYYYDPAIDKKWQLYLYGIIELILFFAVLYYLHKNFLIRDSILIILCPNFVDLSEAIYKIFYFFKLKLYSTGLFNISSKLFKLPALWFCHYKGWFPIDNSKLKIYHLPRVPFLISISVDIILVILIYMLF